MKKVCVMTESFLAECSVERMLEAARQKVSVDTGYVLAESPRQVICRPWAAGLSQDEAKECHSIIVFCPEAEVRMEKAVYSQQGSVRCLWHHDAGEELYMREERYLLRHDAGIKGTHLQHVEYFKEAPSGMLAFHCARLAGVSGGERP